MNEIIHTSVSGTLDIFRMGPRCQNCLKPVWSKHEGSVSLGPELSVTLDKLLGFFESVHSLVSTTRERMILVAWACRIR